MPLADQLFENRQIFVEALNRYSRLKPILERLRHRPDSTSVEQVLEQINSEAATYRERLKHLAAARYYIQEIIWNTQDSWAKKHHGVTNQLAMLDQIDQPIQRREEVAIATFNYDTMIEEALAQYGCSIASVEDYIKGPYLLFKLHGSKNWMHPVHSPHIQLSGMHLSVSAATLIERIEDVSIHISEEIAIINSLTTNTPNGQGYFPALALPLIAKSNFVCPSTHMTALVDRLPSVDRILIIGWRGGESHFLKLLKDRVRKDASYLIINGKEVYGREALTNLASSGIAGYYKILDQGFSDFVHSRGVEEFVKCGPTADFLRF